MNRVIASAYSAPPLPLWERHRPPSAAVLKRTPKRSFGYVASIDVIRVRGLALTIGRDPSPQPSKSELRSSRPTRGEGTHRCCGHTHAMVQSGEAEVITESRSDAECPQKHRQVPRRRQNPAEHHRWRRRHHL